MGNYVDLWEMAKTWEIASVFDKCPTYVGIDLEIWGNG